MVFVSCCQASVQPEVPAFASAEFAVLEAGRRHFQQRWLTAALSLFNAQEKTARIARAVPMVKAPNGYLHSKRAT
jgi:hypothetical protein